MPSLQLLPPIAAPFTTSQMSRRRLCLKGWNRLRNRVQAVTQLDEVTVPEDAVAFAQHVTTEIRHDALHCTFRREHRSPLALTPSRRPIASGETERDPI